MEILDNRGPNASYLALAVITDNNCTTYCDKIKMSNFRRLEFRNKMNG